MKTIYLFLTLIPFLAATKSPAQSNELQFDNRGALLCSYAMSVGLKAMSTQCQASNAKLQNLFKSGIEQHRTFVLRNSETTFAELDAFEAQHSDLGNRTCDNLAADQWLAVLNQLAADPSEYLEEVEHSLAVDRKPVWNPCL